MPEDPVSSRPRASVRGTRFHRPSISVFRVLRRLAGAPVRSSAVFFLLLVPPGLLLPSACTFSWKSVEVGETDPSVVALHGATPIRAYLLDGSIVVLPGGAFVNDGVLMGEGTHYTLTLDSARPFRGVPVDSVIGLETFWEQPDRQADTAVIGLLSIPFVALGAALGFVLVFGSCPTIYAEVDGALTLQSEPFSYSIAPLFESRDVDRITAREDERGVLRLELRNEALETHYLNHMELLRVAHGTHEEVLSDPQGRPLALSGLEAPLSAVDRDGRDVLDLLLRSDDRAFRSDPGRLARATREDARDHLELEVPVTPGSNEIALLFRFRNTLLNTVLFYDVMLANSGIRAVDWLGTELDRIGTAAELAAWYQRHMGLHVEVEGEDGFVLVEQMPDAGPLAWTERALVVPLDPAWTASGRVRLRLSFVSDSWFIDRIGVAGTVRRPEISRIPVTAVRDADGAPDPEAVRLLAAADEGYMVTYPGSRYALEFQLPDAAPGSERTHLLATQGYYVEWIRGAWLQGDPDRAPFRPDDRAILEAIERWIDVMEDYERDFHASRIPVR